VLVGTEDQGDDPQEPALQVLDDPSWNNMSTSVMPGTAASGSTWSM
jgi:hypothetical protein